jgi:tetratricopeptide (TPR) repeat protein
LSPDEYSAKLRESMLHQARGLRLAKQGQYDEAIAEYDQAIAAQVPHSPSPFLARGDANMAKGDYDQAIADYTHAIEMQPSVMTYHPRGAAYAAKGDYQRAIADYDKAIDFQPNVLSYNFRGIAYYRSGDRARAAADFDRAIAVNATYAPVYQNRGRLLSEQGKTTEAMADFRKVLELSTDPTLRQQAEQALASLGVK